ncbi:MAG: response regulator [Cyanobacteria bacterium CRU_2_1]|nr:response regulator [Cyanobacteria bacterium RU_5_0]NJR57567.1 response regulator [Cyanobacteria bacterium CRU_2_1]
MAQKILIIDDSKAVRMQIKEMLPKGNFEVLEAGDGVEGLDLMQQESPNLVLLDFFMPRMNGWEVVQQIQTHPTLSGIPIVLMSGRREEVEQKIPDLMNYFEFIGKPFEQPLLVKAIKSAMVKAKNRQHVTSTPHPAITSAQVPVASSDSSASRSSDAAMMQTLKAEVHALRQENVKLRTDVESLKKQVSQIMAFLRQRK